MSWARIAVLVLVIIFDRGGCEEWTQASLKTFPFDSRKGPQALPNVTDAERQSNLAGISCGAFPRSWTAQSIGGDMIDLYGSGSPNVARVFIALEELGLPYQAHAVDVFAGQQFEAWFEDLNPNRKVPVIVDHDSACGGCPIFESAAILLYLAEKTGALLPSHPCARYEVIQWMMVQVTTVGPMMGQLVHFTRYAPDGISSYSRDRYHVQVARVFDVMDRKLSGSEFLAGDTFTIADVALFPWTVRLSTYLGDEHEERLVNLTRWRQNVSLRPAVGRALRAQDILRQQSTKPEDADPDTLDRLFGRDGARRT